MSDAKGKPSAVMAREFKGTLAFAEITVNIRGKSQNLPSASTQPTDGPCKPEAWGLLSPQQRGTAIPQHFIFGLRPPMRLKQPHRRR